jgi:hypothetical protein
VVLRYTAEPVNMSWGVSVSWYPLSSNPGLGLTQPCRGVRVYVCINPCSFKILFRCGILYNS